jgi:hypothetical protein
MEPVVRTVMRPYRSKNVTLSQVKRALRKVMAAEQAAEARSRAAECPAPPPSRRRRAEA